MIRSHTQVGSLLFQFGIRFRGVNQFKIRIRFHGAHECVGHADRNVEVVELAAFLLGGDELFNVRMRDVEHCHLCAAPRACRLHGFAGAVKYTHV
jgi:hypothetical protein